MGFIVNSVLAKAFTKFRFGPNQGFFFLLFFSLLGIYSFQNEAKADELSDFTFAQNLYESQDYEGAIAAFEALVGGEIPKLTSIPLILESRKLLGVCLLFTGNVAAAEDQFRLLLAEDPDYLMDPIAYPKEVYQLFQKVRLEIKAQIEKQKQANFQKQREQKQKNEAKRRKEQERMAALETLAATETVERVNSRLVATIPFGVGQFQNGHDEFGYALAISEGILLALSITTFYLHHSLRNPNSDFSSSNPQLSSSVERGLRITNWVSFGVLGGLIGIGIADAHVRFVPSIRSERQREIPAQYEPQTELSLTPGGASFSLRF